MSISGQSSNYKSAQLAPPPPIPGVQFVPNPMPAAQDKPTLNGMTALFQSLTNSDSVIKPNFDFVKGFKRAVKVFVMSYPEIVDSIRPTHRRRLQEYINEMAILYNLRSPDMSFLTNMYRKAKKRQYIILISCKKVVVRDQLSNPHLVFTINGKQFKQRIDTQNEVQPYAPIKIGVNFDTFVILRSDANQRIVFTIEEDSSAQPQQEELKHFDLVMANTHPEGFEDWKDFGRGVKLLINVAYKLKKGFIKNTKKVSTFHMKTIELMLKNRLNANQSNTLWKHFKHQESATKYRVTYRRRYVDPNTDNYFWAKPDIGRPQSSRSVVKFIDMQIMFGTNDKFEDKFCLCNEWCNWNAFFYYNPIYRFLLVRHHQLYVKNMSNIPDMYLCLAVLSSCGSGPALTTPIFPLISCANDYRKRYYDNYYLKKRKNFQRLYETSKPSPMKLNALTYNKLRYDLDVTKLCHFSDNNPFSDNCVENLIHYYNVLIDLHRQLSTDKKLVLNRKEWAKEMDLVGRNKYDEYIKQSYDKCIAHVLIGYDYLFTDDYDYDFQLSQTLVIQQIMRTRSMITIKLLADSPFNVRVTLNSFLNTFASISKFLAKVDPILPVPYKPETFEILKSCYIQMDTDFDDYMNANMTFVFQIDSMNSRFNHLRQNFEVFYTLKVYFYAFEIQKHCINSLLEYNKNLYHINDQLCQIYRFIWNNSMVEQKYRNLYPGEVLFETPYFSPDFDRFYKQFWGSAQHEYTTLPDLSYNIESAHFEYQRLNYWMTNYGNTKQVFIKIIDSFISFLLDIRNRSEQIFYDQIILSLQRLPQSYPFSAEVFDHLVYYLVKANCSVILSTVANFFKPIHALQRSDLVFNSISYSLSKPGWVPLITTLNTVLSALDDLKTRYILYDDEFNRISNTCLQTKQMIKDIYRQFYSKLAFEWLDEMYVCYQIDNVSRQITEFLVLHLAVGLSFIAVFCDTFRIDFVDYRKAMFKALSPRFRPTLPHQSSFVTCINTCKSYLQDRQVIAEASPFDREPWSSQLNQILTQFNANTGQQLRIDLNAANV